MVRWRLEYDPLGLSVDDNIEEFDKRQLARFEALSEIIRDTIDDVGEGFEEVIPPDKIESVMDDMAGTFSDIRLTLDADLYGTELGKAIVTVVPRGVVDRDDEVESLAAEMFDLDTLTKIGSGAASDVYRISDERVLKVLKLTDDDEANLSRLAQHMAEGIHKDLPKVLKRGLDYVEVERIDVDEERAERLLQPVSNAVHEVLYRGDDFEPQEINDVLMGGLKEIDEATGSNLSLIEEFPSTTGAFDIIAPGKRGENVGFRGDVPVLIDAGTLSIAAPVDFLEGTVGISEEDALQRITTIKGARDDLAEQRDDRTIGERFEELEKMLSVVERMAGPEVSEALRELDVNRVLEQIPERAMPLVKAYIKKSNQFYDAVRDQSVVESIGDFDVTKAVETTFKKDVVLREVSTVEEAVLEQAKRTQEMFDFFTKGRDILEEAEDVSGPDYFTLTHGRLTTQDSIHTNVIDPAEHNKLILNDLSKMYSVLIVKEILKNTDFNLKYSILADQPDVDYSMEMENAVKKVVKHYISVIDGIIKGVV